MMSRFVQHVRVERPPMSETAAEARERFREKFPRASLRRMTHLGMLLGAALEEIAVQPDDAVVYASAYAETRALEDFLKSFPTASPLLFQTSIHPGGVQQVLIGRQQCVARLWPLAGRTHLVEQALTTALLESAPRVIVVGGEERGTWLGERGVASDRAFAFALVLTRERDGALGEVTFSPIGPLAGVSGFRDQVSGIPNPQSAIPDPQWPGPLAAACRHKEIENRESKIENSGPPLASFADALAENKPLKWRGPRGGWAIDWV